MEQNPTNTVGAPGSLLSHSPFSPSTALFLSNHPLLKTPFWIYPRSNISPLSDNIMFVHLVWAVEGSVGVERWSIGGTACVESGTVGRGCVGDVLV